MDDESYLNSPLGLLFVTMGENHELVSFSYPFNSDSVSATDSAYVIPSERSNNSHYCHEQDVKDAEQYGVSTKILAHLLSAKGMCDMPFEIKIDNIRFAGFPKTVTNPTGKSPQIFHVVFVFVANAPAHLVQSFQVLSRKIALAIDEEQTRCGYLSQQMTVMLNAHDKTDTLSDVDQYVPYREILQNSSLAKDLQDIFNDVCDYGMVHVFVNNCVEIGFCIETRSLLHAGLTPKSRAEIEAIIRHIRPYHGILLLEDAIPSPDSNPSVRLLLKHCEPDRSILGMSNSSGLPLVQVLLVVRHLLLWARAVIIYPLCSSNVYSSATPPKPLAKLSEQFSEIFEKAQLPAILAHFSPPCTLGEFANPWFYSIEEQRRRVRMVARLLRDELIVQLHTFIYVLPPFSNEACNPDELSALRDEGLRRMIEKAPLPGGVKPTIAKICSLLRKNSSHDQVECTLALFIRLLPFLNGEHHIEDIMYRMNLERSVVVRVLDSFASVLTTFSRPDFIKE